MGNSNKNHIEKIYFLWNKIKIYCEKYVKEKCETKNTRSKRLTLTTSLGLSIIILSVFYMNDLVKIETKFVKWFSISAFFFSFLELLRWVPIVRWTKKIPILNVIILELKSSCSFILYLAACLCITTFPFLTPTDTTPSKHEVPPDLQSSSYNVISLKTKASSIDRTINQTISDLNSTEPNQKLVDSLSLFSIGVVISIIGMRESGLKEDDCPY